MTVDLAPGWMRLPVAEAFLRLGSQSMEKALETGRFDEVMAHEIEPRLGKTRPVFLYDYPAACGALARLKPEDPSVAERFELYIAGLELCNAFSELTDPVEQRSRFKKEMQARRKAGAQVYPLPEKFLGALKQMPTSTGNALGIDRLIMLFADACRIDDVVAFTPEHL